MCGGLLSLYSDACASNQYRALQQFFKWLAEEEQLPDPMARLHPSAVSEKLGARLHQRRTIETGESLPGPSLRPAARRRIIAEFRTTGIRAAVLAGIRYDAHDPQASDADLWQREITVRGKGGKPRVVKITHDAARALDRYIRVSAGHAQAWRRHEV
jgi:site-specific recombinase XerC